MKDKNPLAPFTLAGANATVKLAEGTYVIGEVARTQSGLDDKKGNAARSSSEHAPVPGAQFVDVVSDADPHRPAEALRIGDHCELAALECHSERGAAELHRERQSLQPVGELGSK